MMHSLRHRCKRSLSGLANKLGAVFPVGTELLIHSLVEFHAQDRRTVGHDFDLELQGPLGELFAEVREHLVDLGNREGAAEGWYDRGNKLFFSHMKLKV
ncbi:MAG: hypothetical protein E6K69_02660 [Nitrospirae bacterium]|nr:MAG: hypothetical protein E6K69_02660 [Nitrospirota bacterium]